MKRASLLSALLALAILLSACGSSGAKLEIYRIVAPYYREGGELVRSETVTCSPGVGLINAAISAFNAEPADQELMNPLPNGLQIIGCRLIGSELRLTLSPEYAALTGIGRTLADCCLTLTFCGIEGVSSVAVYSNGRQLRPPLSKNDIILADLSAQID
ncbi:MAG: GerMN domain-containing protein [Oscillospiraceae bacterium]